MAITPFEVTLPGFDGGTDEFDNRVKWVLAYAAADVVAWAPAGSTIVEMDDEAPALCTIDYIVPPAPEAVAADRAHLDALVRLAAQAK